MPLQLSVRKVPLTAAEILVRARAGDSAGIAALYGRYAAALFRTAFRICGSRADAEDMVHDLFVGLPDALRRYDEFVLDSIDIKPGAVAQCITDQANALRNPPVLVSELFDTLRQLGLVRSVARLHEIIGV